MDPTRREITKIAREVSRFTVSAMKEDGIGTAELDLIHAVRKHPGITQAELCEVLQIDKGAAARRAARLEAKGFLERRANPADGRSRLLYPTGKAESLKHTRAATEAGFYIWLTSCLTDGEREAFCATLDRLYRRCRAAKAEGYPDAAAAAEAEQKEDYIEEE